MSSIDAKLFDFEADPSRQGSLSTLPAIGEGSVETGAVSKVLPAALLRNNDLHVRFDENPKPLTEWKDLGAVEPMITPKLTIRPRVVMLEQWEGTVIDVQGDSFTAQLCSLTSQAPEESATLSLNEISDFDRSLVVEGGVFYWTIAARYEAWGQKVLQSTIRFRRLPAWTKNEISRAHEKARRFKSAFAKHPTGS